MKQFKSMWRRLMIFKLLLIPYTTADQHQYKVVTKNMTLVYVNPKYIDIKVGTFRLYQENAINASFTLQFDPTEDNTVTINALKWLGNDFRIPTLQIKKGIKDVLDMESFDLDALFMRYSEPPMIWPLKKGVTYHLIGWIPDSTKFPPNLPDGKWKASVTEEFGNKTKISTVHWYFDIEYFKP